LGAESRTREIRVGYFGSGDPLALIAIRSSKGYGQIVEKKTGRTIAEDVLFRRDKKLQGKRARIAEDAKDMAHKQKNEMKVRRWNKNQDG